VPAGGTPVSADLLGRAEHALGDSGVIHGRQLITFWGLYPVFVAVMASLIEISPVSDDDQSRAADSSIAAKLVYVSASCSTTTSSTGNPGNGAGTDRVDVDAVAARGRVPADLGAQRPARQFPSPALPGSG
jgi:hypothetical protein